MKRKEKNTMFEMKPAELRKQIKITKDELATLKLTKSTKQVKNLRAPRELRKKLAVMLTYLRQKELAHETV